MRVSCKWLEELAPAGLTPEDICARLTALGLETNIAEDRRGWFQGIVIGKVLATVKHPDADKLTLCKVDVGDGKTLDIVCGAPNVAVGQLVPVATIGALLPGGMKIEKRKVRGQASEGMICSEEELLLSTGGQGIMALDDNPAPGRKFSEAYEVCDTILEVDLTPNRGDCLSMIGVARELAAASGVPLCMPDGSVKEDSSAKAGDKVSVDIQAPDLCPRYAARVITGLTVGPSPFWMRRRLTAVGVRSINNLVDVTNYILMETGHPLHAFDMKRISGGRIIVRRAAAGERFTTLDGKTHTLSADNLVIADAARAVALAGVMGGANSEVKETTADVILEAAFFNPASIRRTSKGLGIKTESSYRFERGCDVEGMIFAQDRAALLMAQLAGGRVLAGRVDAYPKRIEKRRIKIRRARTEAILGLAVPMERIENILNRLEMKTVSRDGESITVEAPHFRFDMEREIDLIEEVARNVGYGEVKPQPPEVPVSLAGLTKSLQVRRALRRHLRSLGLMEGMGYSFISPADLDKFRVPQGHPWRRLVAIDNPLTADWTHMRPSLLPGLVSAVKGTGDTALFEIGSVFEETGAGQGREQWTLGVLLTENGRPGLWDGAAPKRDFFHIKGVAEAVLGFLGFDGARFTPSAHPFFYPKRQADILIGGKIIGWLGQIRPETTSAHGVEQALFAMEMDLDAATSILPKPPTFQKLPKFPPVNRDLAVVVDVAVTAEALLASIRTHGGQMVKEAEVFDVYSGEKIGQGKKSVAFSLKFMEETRTLVDEEANATLERIVAGLAKDFDARLR
jgi:phenylalanyl-tRNA synthetase beta chain